MTNISLIKPDDPNYTTSLLKEVMIDNLTLKKKEVEFKNKTESFRNGTKLSKKEHEQLNSIGYELSCENNTETHILIHENAGEKHGPLAYKFCNDLIEEYDCKTPSERALAQNITMSYIRILKYSRRLDNLLDIEYLSNEKNGFYSTIGRELDRAYKQFNSGLAMLKQLKAPRMNIKVNTEHAYIAENQLLQNNSNDD